MLKSTKDKKGWLLPYLLALDEMFFKRWSYWTEMTLNNRLSQEPIPYIPFQPSNTFPEKLVFKNIMDCLKRERYSSYALENFVDWILWGFNQGESFPKIKEEVDDHWYRKFNLGLFYKEPADHWPDIYFEIKGSKNSNGFFPTPAPVVELMTRMNFGDLPSHEHKTKSVLDPCCGTGSMLLYASNYSLNLFGQDISLLMTKIVTINAFIYIPWLTYRPKHLTIFDKGIENLELASGIRIPVCQRCSAKSSEFYMDLLTNAHLRINKGDLELQYPEVSSDLVNKKISAETVSCIHCDKEEISS